MLEQIVLYASIVFIFFQIIRRFWKYPDRNAVFGWPLIGFAFTKLTPTTYISMLHEMSIKYGPIYDVFAFTKRFTIVCNIDDMQEILTKRPKLFQRPNSPITARVGLSDGIVASNGNKWSMLRRLTAPSFSKKGIGKFLDDIWEESKKCVTNLKSDGNTATNFIDATSTYTIRVIGKVAFGFREEDNNESSYFYSNEFKADLIKIGAYIVERMLFVLPYFIWKRSSKFIIQTQAVEAKDRMFVIGKQIIAKEREKSSKYDGTYLHSLIRAEDNAALSDEEVVSNVMSIFIAGTDTTSISICWVMYFLCLNRSVLTSLRSEVDQVFDTLVGKSTTDVILNALSLCQACMIEAMRLRGPVTHVTVQTVDRKESVTLRSGAIIRSTDLVWCEFETLKMDPQVFPDPHSFNPHRWINSNFKQLEKMNKYCMTFGYGPRECPGQALTEAEGPFLIAQIVRELDFQLACPESEIFRRARVTVGPNKMPIVFSPRTDK